ncbi:hypothetical protein [Plantactinospora soyae]|uniref:Uncharacterized protein n=1 Tax=Plantactinospora soyae TaxID=1544732 RepID=A0A927QVI2_9ACTN|nr:hypothetical protein [Plantactinospora soyae]MBE1485760.1 hypothetical protein [Plantactinospora soyae]
MATTCTAARTAGAPPPPELATALALLPLWTPLALPRLARPDQGISIPAGTTVEAGSADQHQIGGMASTRRFLPGR